MLARRMTTILPKLTQADQQEALCDSLGSQGRISPGLLAGDRPFRSRITAYLPPGSLGEGDPCARARSAWHTVDASF